MGGASWATAAVLGASLNAVYVLLGPGMTGPRVGGPPGVDCVLLIASALLGGTFPFLWFLAAGFACWRVADRG